MQTDRIVSPVRGTWREFSCARQGVCPLLLPPEAGDGEVYVLTKTAAEAMGVAMCTISQWARRGYLTPMPWSPPRKPVYRLSDVRKAEKLTRDNALRTSGTDRQVQRMRGLGS